MPGMVGLSLLRQAQDRLCPPLHGDGEGEHSGRCARVAGTHHAGSGGARESSSFLMPARSCAGQGSHHSTPFNSAPTDRR
jgi:hypothetical protein